MPPGRSAHPQSQAPPLRLGLSALLAASLETNTDGGVRPKAAQAHKYPLSGRGEVSQRPEQSTRFLRDFGAGQVSSTLNYKPKNTTWKVDRVHKRPGATTGGLTDLHCPPQEAPPPELQHKTAASAGRRSPRAQPPPQSPPPVLSMASAEASETAGRRCV